MDERLNQLTNPNENQDELVMKQLLRGLVNENDQEEMLNMVSE